LARIAQLLNHDPIPLFPGSEPPPIPPWIDPASLTGSPHWLTSCCPHLRHLKLGWKPWHCLPGHLKSWHRCQAH